MPNIKELFDKNQYDNYIKETNYTGALNYLTDLYNNTDDFSEKDIIKPFITNLRQKIHKDESMIRYTSDDTQRQQYYFLDAVNNGTILKGNTYYDTFTKALNSLGNSYDKNGNQIAEANQVEFKFENKHNYTNFLDKLGVNEQSINKLNILVGDNNGSKTVAINKSNPLFYKLINAVYESSRDNIKDIQNLAKSSLSFSPYSDPLTQALAVRQLQKGNDIKMQSRDRKGNIISEYSTVRGGNFNDTMNSISSMLADAKTNYNNLERASQQDLLVSSFSLPWKTAAHARAEELLASTGDTTEYDKTIKRLDEQLSNAMYSLILSQQNVWSTTEVDDANYHKLGLEESHSYQQILRDAIRENRYNVRLAMLGDKFGYQIDIMPVASEKGVFYDKADNANIQRTMFIENPWKTDDLTNAFEQRTEFKAMKEFILMNMYKYPYDFDDGSSLSIMDELSGVYKHSDGYEELIDRNKMLSILNEEFIKEDGIRAFQRKYSDSQNRPKFNIGKFEDDIDKQVWLYAQQAAAELVPDVTSNEYARKTYDLYTSILNNIHYKGKPAITLQK